MMNSVVLAKNDDDILDVLLSPDDVENNFDNAIFHLKPRPSKQQHRPDSFGRTSLREEEGGGGKEEASSSPMSNVADIDVDVNGMNMNRFDNLSLWMTPREFIVSSEPMLPPRLNLSHKMESGEVLCNQHVHIKVASAPSFPHLSNPKTPR